MEWDDRKKEVEVLAEIDESAAYEVDMNAVVFDPKTKDYALLSASGCSCWDGDYDESSHYATLDELENALVTGKEGTGYHPTLAGVEQLMREAREANTKAGR